MPGHVYSVVRERVNDEEGVSLRNNVLFQTAMKHADSEYWKAAVMGDLIIIMKKYLGPSVHPSGVRATPTRFILRKKIVDLAECIQDQRSKAYIQAYNI